MMCSNVIVNVVPPARQVIESDFRRVLGGPDGRSLTFMEEEPEPFGAAGTLAAIRSHTDDGVLTWNADTISDLDLRGLIDVHLRAGLAATVAVVPVASGADCLVLRDRAIAFIDRRLQSDAGGGQFIGAAVFEKTVLDALPDERPLGLAEAILHPLVQRGELAVFEHHGYAADVGTFPRYIEASIDLLEGRGPEPPIPWPGEVVAVPGGAAYLGPGASAAQGALGPGAILLAGSRVEEGAFVERSIVWRDAVIPSGENVVGSVHPWFRGRRATG
jgi:mannose-1-phosphate guanylyltransferase